MFNVFDTENTKHQSNLKSSDLSFLRGMRIKMFALYGNTIYNISLSCDYIEQKGENLNWISKEESNPLWYNPEWQPAQNIFSAQRYERKIEFIVHNLKSFIL